VANGEKITFSNYIFQKIYKINAYTESFIAVPREIQYTQWLH